MPGLEGRLALVTGAGVAQARRVVDEAAAALAGLDVLVNNSVVTRSAASVETTPECTRKCSR